jgi:hypothetical protein
MNLPPMILDLKVAAPDRQPVHVWLPLFLLWPLVLALAVVALVFTLLADVALLVLGRPYHHYSLLLVRSLLALGDARGMVIRFNDEQTAVDLTVQ